LRIKRIEEEQKKANLAEKAIK
jgi:hypothetical protein